MRVMGIATEIVVIGTLLVACGFPQPADVPSDAPPTDALVAPVNTVVGRSTLICVQTAGSVVTPVDLSASVINALIPDADSTTGYRVMGGVGSSDGTFVIHDVPDGLRYMLQINNSYFDTASHVLDDGSIVTARCDPTPVPTTASTPITFALSGVSEIRPGDSVNATSLALGVLTDMSPPPTHQSTLTVATDWFANAFSIVATSPPLLDQSVGDDLTLIHHRSARQLGADGRLELFDQILEVGSASGVEMRDGIATTIAVAVTPVAANRTLSLTINRAAYDGGFDVNTSEQGVFVDVFANSNATDVEFGEELLDIDLDDWSGKGPLVHKLTNVPYADPFPGAWHRYMQVQYDRGRRIALPNATATVNSAFSIRTTDLPIGAFAATDNIVQLPANILLAGVPFAAGGMIHFDGVAPVELRWGGVATAKEYVVRVLRVFNDNGATRRSTIATLATDTTSVKIPAQVFAGATSFAFELAAITSPTDYSAGHLTPDGLPSGRMAAPSGLFLFSATCGNGVVETAAGEACDGSGETAQCDVDCTAVACGDGLLNATNGEECDTSEDTQGCNAGTCKTSRCGDGYLNEATEDCDFGGSNAANGCGSNCRWLGRCGDGAVQVPEDCDPGGSDSANCNFDCTFVRCGDAYINVAAGEQCDDGDGHNGHDLVCGSACKRL